MNFHAANLIPGSSYMLRVVLFERTHALAVSVRSFRVAALSIAGAMGSSDDFNHLQLNAYTQLITDCKLVDSASKYCKQAQFDQAFIAVDSSNAGGKFLALQNTGARRACFPGIED